MREKHFTDTTFRNGHASLWAEGMRTATALAAARDIDKAGFRVVEVIGAGHIKKPIRVRRDPGYPIMATPHSQFVVGQATINVISKERYKVVTDELIKYTPGSHGEEAGGRASNETKAIILDQPRTDSLAEIKYPEPALDEISESFGGGGIPDDEMSLRFAVGGEGDANVTREAGPVKNYSTGGPPLLELAKTLAKRKDLRHVTIRQPELSPILEDNGTGDYLT